MDWLHIQKRSRRVLPFDEHSLHTDEALQFLNGPDFIPPESLPAGVDFDSGPSGLNFTFPTPRPGRFVENNTVHGRIFRCGGHWQERPTIVLLHGGSTGRGRINSLGYQYGFSLIARRCNRAGFNAATLEAPYHFRRHPRQPGAVTKVDYLRMAEAARRAVNVLLVAGTEDLITPIEPIEDLHQAWGQPEIWRLSHGHISLSWCLWGVAGSVLCWLTPRLNNPAVTDQRAH